MREILFRGKDADNGEWVYGYYAHFKNMHDVKADIIYTGYADMYMGSILPECYDINPKTIGQYTGLTDKNGKKIFEHDILKAYDPLDKRYFIGVVKYFDASFYICDTKSVPCYFGEYCFTDFEVEVIGNIYDNPELMGGNTHG